MARILTIPANGSVRPGIRTRTIKRSALAGPVSLQLIFIVTCTLVGLFYLFQSNRVTTEHLKVRALEQQKSQVQQDNERLQVEAARLQSVQQIKKQADAEKMTRTTRAAAYERTGADQSQTSTAPADQSSSTEG